MTEMDGARAHSANDPRVVRAVVACLGALEKHFPELESLPDRRVMALEVKLESAVREVLGIEVAKRGEQRHGGRR